MRCSCARLASYRPPCKPVSAAPGRPLDGLTADEQLEVAGQLRVGILQAARHPFARSAGDRAAYDTLCDTVEEWVTTEVYKLRFARTQ